MSLSLLTWQGSLLCFYSNPLNLTGVLQSLLTPLILSLTTLQRHRIHYFTTRI